MKAFAVELCDALSDAEDKYDAAKRKYLEKRGWKYTSDTPSCHWLWQKKTPDGRTLLTSEATAIMIQQGADSISGDTLP